MTISYVATGTVVAATGSVSPPYPAGVQANDLAIITCVSGHPSGSIPTTPAGWEPVKQVSGVTGAYASNAGPRALSFFARVLSGGDPVPVINIATGAGSVIGAATLALRRSAGNGWRYSAAIGEVTVAVTGLSAAASEPLTFAPGDFEVLGYALPVSTASISAESIAATGVTFSARTQRANSQISAGNNVRLGIATATVTAGSGSTLTPPTVGATVSAASIGMVGALRVREATATIVATVQNADPPRNEVAINNLLPEEIVNTTVERIVGDATAFLRGATAVDTTGDNALVRVDAEMPFGGPVSYRATLIDILGDTWQISSNSVSSDIINEILSDATTGLGVACQIISWTDRRYVRESTDFNVSGRIVVVSGPQPSPTSTIVLFTGTTADRNAMLALLATATNGTVQIRTHATAICLDDPGYDSHAQVDSYLQIKSTVLERSGKFRYPQRNWEIEVVETEPWPLAIEARGFTLQDIADYFAGQSLQAIKDKFTPGTLFDIAVFDWSV